MTTELRGNWVSHDSIETFKDRKRLIQNMIQAKLNTALVAVPPIRDNYGEGTLEAFFTFINEAKSEGLVVFGWISNHKRTFPTPADLRKPEERIAQARWVEDLLIGFPCLDGIAIDYIRYPTWEPSNEEKLEGISLTVKAIRDVTDMAGVTLISTSFPAATITFRGKNKFWEADVPEWYREWYALNSSNYFHLEAASGGTGIVNQINLEGSHPDYLLGPSFFSYQQDPTTWMGNHLVDHLVPMQYTADTQVMRNEVDLWVSFTTFAGRSMDLINLGLGWFDEPSSFPDSKFDAAAMVSHIEYGRSKGVGGYTIFRLGIPGVDDGPLIEALTMPIESIKGGIPPNPTEATSPFQNFGLVCRSLPQFRSHATRSQMISSSIWTTTLLLVILAVREVFR
jgi:hypothetical protein